MELNEEIEYLKKENEKLRLRSEKKETRKQDYNSESSKIINEAKEIKKMYFAEKDTSKNKKGISKGNKRRGGDDLEMSSMNQSLGGGDDDEAPSIEF